MGTKDLIAAGINKGTLCTIMQENDARPETLGKVAKALGVDVTEIIDLQKREVNEYEVKH